MSSRRLSHESRGGCETLKVGEVAKRVSLGVQTLHFYERSGLLPKPKRSAANYRLNSNETVRRVWFIKKAQALGLTLDEIREIPCYDEKL